VSYHHAIAALPAVAKVVRHAGPFSKFETPSVTVRGRRKMQTKTKQTGAGNADKNRERKTEAKTQFKQEWGRNKTKPEKGKKSCTGKAGVTCHLLPTED
jgi:hypothetical protein